MNNQSFQIQRKRLADQVADRLMQQIADGTLKSGDRLPSEPELMKQFDVGRSSIREAIGALSLTGILTVRPGQGTHVAGFSSSSDCTPIGLLAIGPEKVRELVEARVELEGVIARLAAQRATQKDLQNIRSAHLELYEALSKKETLINADIAFHSAVAKASHNDVLIKFFTEMRQPTRHWMKQKAKFDWGYEKVYEQHDQILKAIEAKDGPGSEAALKAHLHSTGEKLVAALLENQSHCE